MKKVERKKKKEKGATAVESDELFSGLLDTADEGLFADDSAAGFFGELPSGDDVAAKKKGATAPTKKKGEKVKKTN